MKRTLSFRQFAAGATLAIVLFNSSCSKAPEYIAPTEAEMDTSDHDLPNGDQITEDQIIDEEGQTQNLVENVAVKSLDAGGCKTKYPILLVHGVALNDSLLGVNYFGRIPKHLKSKCQVDVYQGGQDAFSVSEVNADQLKEKLLYLTDKLGYKKVNIIAHSKGGIDIRFMFYQDKGKLVNGRTLNDRVASFTTLATPHRGSALADYLLARLGKVSLKLIYMGLNVLGFAQGDSDESDAAKSMSALAHSVMGDWNVKLGDLDSGVQGVYCQSWAANISGYIMDPSLWTTSKMIASDGYKVNDGAVEEASAKYANYRGVVGSGIFGGVSHFAIVDRAASLVPGITPGFNVLDFYTKMLSELKEKGY